MKIIISESKLNSAIIQYLDELYDVNDIHSTNPYMYDDDTGEEYEDGNIIDFYRGDYDGPYDSDFCFRYYTEEYFLDGSPKYRNRGPLLEVRDEVAETLDGYFGDFWYEPFKKWFESNFELPVKTVKKGISG